MKFVQLYSVIEDNKISITLLCISFSIIQHELLQNLILNFKKNHKVVKENSANCQQLPKKM